MPRYPGMGQRPYPLRIHLTFGTHQLAVYLFTLPGIPQTSRQEALIMGAYDT